MSTRISLNIRNDVLNSSNHYVMQPPNPINLVINSSHIVVYFSTCTTTLGQILQRVILLKWEFLSMKVDLVE